MGRIQMYMQDKIGPVRLKVEKTICPLLEKYSLTPYTFMQETGGRPASRALKLHRKIGLMQAAQFNLRVSEIAESGCDLRFFLGNF